MNSGKRAHCRWVCICIGSKIFRSSNILQNMSSSNYWKTTIIIHRVYYYVVLWATWLTLNFTWKKQQMEIGKSKLKWEQIKEIFQTKLSSYMMLISKPTRWEIFQTKLSSYMMLISKPTRWGILYLNLYTYCLFLKNSILKFLWRNCLTYWLIFLRIKKFSRYTMSNVWLLFRPLYIWDMCR